MDDTNDGAADNPEPSVAKPSVDISGRSFTYPGGRTIRAWDSAELLDGEDEAVIQHGGETYRLRLTRHGGLILNK
ncbi:hemin uptake protein HemP [Ochrobactrum sp. MC-1LL]|uniref:hemin uptake protein HemP n=1 Tax=Ochrobactrum sp. MC-1LL TaxID=2735351 RepID=UPI00336C06C3